VADAEHGRVLPTPDAEDTEKIRVRPIGGARRVRACRRADLREARRMIEVEDLSKNYGAFAAVRELSFAVRPGEVLGLVGPNGAGKTSTLRCLAGIIPASGGSVRIAGHDVATDPVAAKRALAFFPDEPRLFEYLTVRQHLSFVARIYGVADHEALAGPLLEELEIADKADELPGALSRGMKQKLAIACGLLHAPKVMFFDEPLTGLDPLGIRRMKDSILKRARDGAAIVLSSHLLHLLEEVCSHVLILKKGEKIADGTLGEIAARFANGEAGVSLEEIFIRATGGSES
jgi:ABC-2 type transport system ATP-binding protein